MISTSIRDVVKPYGQEKLVYIADRPHDFIVFAQKALNERRKDSRWLEKVDKFLAGMSWDRTWRKMVDLERSTNRERVRPMQRHRTMDGQIANQGLQ